MNYAITAVDYFSVAAHPHLRLYLKSIKQCLSSPREIKEAVLSIHHNPLLSNSSTTKHVSASIPRGETYSSTDESSGATETTTEATIDKFTQYPFD